MEQTKERMPIHRWWNSFTFLAVILLGIGIVGMIAGQRMVFDPGRAASGREWVVYLVAGALMLINGLLPTAAREDDAAPQAGGK
jgi:uncharacterized membrane protein HdeD (DUF308 family)